MDLSNLEIKEALIEDANEIAKVTVQSWNESFIDVFPKELLLNLDWKSISEKRRKFIHESNIRKCLVASINNKIIGFCDLGPIRSSSEVLSIGEIYAIYILKKYQHHNVGSSLFKKAVQSLRELGYSEFIVWVLKANVNAKNFYRKHKGIESSLRTRMINNMSFEELQFKFIIA